MVRLESGRQLGQLIVDTAGWLTQEHYLAAQASGFGEDRRVFRGVVGRLGQDQRLVASTGKLGHFGGGQQIAGLVDGDGAKAAARS